MTDTLPLISCICPTRNRRAFLYQSLQLFEAQDYPNKELIILEDGDSYDIPVGFTNSMYYNYCWEQVSIGAKRNKGCKKAAGDIVCMWDDDDYYGPHRLSRQVQPILDNEADVTGMTLETVLNLSNWTAWHPSPALHAEIFPDGVHTGTLLFRRSFWLDGASYPDRSNGEDAIFLRVLRAYGARLAAIPAGDDFCYIRHGASTWPLPPHPHPHMHEWRQFSPDGWLPQELLEVYRTYAPVFKEHL